MKIKLFIFALMTLITQIIHAQTCEGNIANNWQNSRYTNHNNGTVTDNITKLMWKTCSEGQVWNNNNTPADSSDDTCVGLANMYNWQSTLEQASGSHFIGNNDWRLPNIEELKSLVAYNCHDPSINESIFPNTDSNFFLVI